MEEPEFESKSAGCPFFTTTVYRYESELLDTAGVQVRTQKSLPGSLCTGRGVGQDTCCLGNSAVPWDHQRVQETGAGLGEMGPSFAVWRKEMATGPRLPSLPKPHCAGRRARAGAHTHTLALGHSAARPASCRSPSPGPPFPNEHRLAHPMRGRPGFLTEPHVCCLGATPQSQLRLSREEPLPGTENLANAAAVKKGTDDGEGTSPCQAHPTHCCLSSTHLVGGTGEEI